MYVMTIWIEICLLYVLTNQKTKTHTQKKNEVQCLDVYELFDDCVEHDHFYTRRFLIKDPGFALGVCCLLVNWCQKVPGKVLGGQTLWESSGRGVPRLQAFPEIPGSCKMWEMGWDRERSSACPRHGAPGQVWGGKG